MCLANSPGNTSTKNDLSRICSSHPKLPPAGGRSVAAAGEVLGPALSFSQPMNPDNMIMSQFPCTTGNAQTLFFVKTDKVGTLQELEKACEKLGFTSKQGSLGMTTVSTKYGGIKLVFKACLIQMGETCCWTLNRLSKGGGLEFKKRFIKLRNQMDQQQGSSHVTPGAHTTVTVGHSHMTTGGQSQHISVSFCRLTTNVPTTPDYHSRIHMMPD